MSIEVIRAYHERTKHGFGRFARSLGYLDRANQPEPFRWFEGAPRVELAFKTGGDGVSHDDLDFPDDDEGEEPELIAAVTPVPLTAVPVAPAPEVVAAARASEWIGEANLLSDEHMDWDVIEEAAVTTRSPGRPDDTPAAAPIPWPGGRPARDARALVRTRRSAAMFDGQSSIPLDGFARILLHTPRTTRGLISSSRDFSWRRA